MISTMLPSWRKLSFYSIVDGYTQEKIKETQEPMGDLIFSWYMEEMS